MRIVRCREREGGSECFGCKAVEDSRNSVVGVVKVHRKMNDRRRDLAIAARTLLAPPCSRRCVYSWGFMTIGSRD